MRLSICAVGRLKAGPEKTLVDDYLNRGLRAGRPLGFDKLDLIEVEDRKGGGAAAEADLLSKAMPDGAVRVLLDERGKVMTSPDFAQKLAHWRDDGRRAVAFAIGGADGHPPAFRAEADMMLSFGKMVWPHMLARVMLAEQLYRAITILGGSPYHRV